MLKSCPVIAMVAALVLGYSSLSPSAAQDHSDWYRISDGVSRSHVEYHLTTVPKGKETVLADLKGPGKIVYFYVTPVSNLALKVFWDDEAEPSIQAPLADFFGAMRGKTIDYHSQPMEIQHGCYMCYLPMPFSKRARFVLVNDSDQDYKTNMAYGIDYELDQHLAIEKSRLHCMWRRSNPVPGGAPPLNDLIQSSECGGKNNIGTRHTILDVKGRGHYLGNFLQVDTKNPGWWGEGSQVDWHPRDAGGHVDLKPKDALGITMSAPRQGFIPDELPRYVLDPGKFIITLFRATFSFDPLEINQFTDRFKRQIECPLPYLFHDGSGVGF